MAAITYTNTAGRATAARLAAAMIMLAAILLAAPGEASAVPQAASTVIDDFEDGNVDDWGFFGGSNAGGGGGVADDRPQEGGFYFSTGWGGEGTASGFYGGAFRNLDDGAQVALPTDPWFNVWVLNQSDATVDSYTLEITIREDTDGNGWTTGSEDSFRLDTAFASSSFDDRWTLVSAPVDSFVDLGTGGDGTFDGDLDEIVFVIAGVQGPNPSTVEVDFDQLAFSSGGPLAFDRVLFDDMEHGDPFNNDWFSFDGAVGGGGIAANSADLPPVDGGAFSLESGWGSGGTPGFYGGFGRTSPTDLSGTDHFNLWINPDGGQDYTLELNVQDDDNGDGAIVATDDDEFQYDCVISAAGPCAVSGGGWQLVSIPLDDFFDDNSFITGGNGVLDPTPTDRGGNGELISVVVTVIGTGSDVNFRTDNWVFSRGPLVGGGTGPSGTVVQDFESGVAPGTPCAPAAPVLGFCTFSGAGSSAVLSNPTTPPAPTLPAVGTPNSVLQMDVDVTSFGGFLEGFTNPAGDTWVPQDWSTREGISLWFHGTGSGTDLFIDILDNRNPGSTSDDAERHTVAFVDDFVGWQLLEFPFSGFTRKEVGNGAPNDGLGLFEMHGWALGTLGTGGPRSYYVDQVSLYGEAEPPGLAVQFALNNTFIAEGDTGEVGVKLNRPMGPDDPPQVSIDFATERSNAIPGQEFTPTSGTLTFVNGGPSELSFPVETFDDTKFEGDEQIIIRLTNPVDVERGSLFQGSALIEDDDPFDPELLDDFEQGAFLWESDGMLDFGAERVEAGDPGSRPGQDQVESVATASVPRPGPSYRARVEAVVDDITALLPAGDSKQTGRLERALGRLDKALDARNWAGDFFLENDPDGRRFFDRTRQAIAELDRVADAGVPESGPAQAAIDELVAVAAGLADDAIELAQRNGANQTKIDRALREIRQAEGNLAEGKSDRAINHYRNAWSGATRAVMDLVDDGAPVSTASLVRDFPIGQDWTGTESLDFWFNGTGSGEDVTVTLKDNRAPDPGPSGWSLAWADEFDEPAGSPPNPANWNYELGDVTPDGKNGWGNEELQYYTDDPANAATDGAGNLVITLDEADPSLECYYGPCQYESARLITQNKAEFAYGRIESRLRVPDGGDGLWPAFWSLGTDITYNPWPGAGEIDFMEYVSRLPDEIFGTIHGPGYNGGGSFGGIYDFGQPVFDDYHTFVVEWEPNLITWYVDGIQYHQATPADVAPNPWVFEKPFFLLLNFAIGGNFGGPVDPLTAFPQEYAIDYIRVYQGPDTAERFETTFSDSMSGWQQVSIPVTDFVRSADQPAGAPDDGLNLTDVWGYGLDLPVGAGGTYQFDLVRRTPFPPPTELTVTTLADDGAGSLREALALIAADGTITFDPSLAGGTITLTSGQLTIGRSVTVDGPAVPVTISGGGSSRVIEVGAGATVSIDDLVVSDGVAAPQGGGILNRGDLSLDRVVVRDNTENSAGPASFDLGGGGIYNAEGATLALTDSTVAGNVSLNQPGGGIYGFFGTTVTITGSTVSGNVAASDLAGGMRSLGTTTVLNSTFSGNTSTVWHGGGIFHTDGQLTVTNSTFTGNIAPDGTASGIVVATFGAPANLTLTNSVMEGNGGALACATEGGAAATITSGGGNIDNDGSCQLTGPGDQPTTDALLEALADNGGPTLTHALGAGSPAIDSADAGACPATDQRGIARPQGAGCDIGSFEAVP